MYLDFAHNSVHKMAKSPNGVTHSVWVGGLGGGGALTVSCLGLRKNTNMSFLKVPFIQIDMLKLRLDVNPNADKIFRNVWRFARLGSAGDAEIYS